MIELAKVGQLVSVYYADTISLHAVLLCMYIYMYEYCILIQRKRKAKTVTGISKRRKRNTEEKHQVKTPNRRPTLQKSKDGFKPAGVISVAVYKTMRT